MHHQQQQAAVTAARAARLQHSSGLNHAITPASMISITSHISPVISIKTYSPYSLLLYSQTMRHQQQQAAATAARAARLQRSSGLNQAQGLAVGNSTGMMRQVRELLVGGAGMMHSVTMLRASWFDGRG